MQKVLFVLGPTAVGKSAMAINLAKELNGEVISADSVQVFKGFDIGSAKITQDEMQGIKHHLIDICESGQEFSVAEFVKLTEEKIKEISARGRLPIIVGGTFLYVKALTEGYNFGGTEKQEAFRQQLEKEIEEKGSEEVYKRLLAFAPEMAQKVHVNNKNRLIRALEIATFGQKQERAAAPNYDCRIIALLLPREELYLRINKRVDKMMQEGLVDEVKNLLQSGVSEKSQAMRAIGYKEVVAYLKKEIDFDKMTELIKQHSRNYAKRQLTFLRSFQNIETIDVTDFDEAKNNTLKIVKEWFDENN